MNLNLATNQPTDPEGEAESFQDAIDEHQAVMRGAGYMLTDITVLLSEGPDYPGSYQVWSETDEGEWVYVDPDGRVHTAEETPVRSENA